MMKTTTFQKQSLLAAAAGILGFGLRYFLYQRGLDDRGLLVRFHPLELAFWAAAAAAAVLAVLAGRKGPVEGDDKRSSFGCLAMAVGIIFSQEALQDRGTLMTAAWFLMLFSGAGLAFGSAPSIRGNRLEFLAPVGICLFFAIYLVASYRLWSSNPQMQDYVVSMLACVVLMLYAYQQAALQVSHGSDRARRALGILGVFLSLSAIPQSETPLLYLGSAMWVLTSPKSKGTV